MGGGGEGGESAHVLDALAGEAVEPVPEADDALHPVLVQRLGEGGAMVGDGAKHSAWEEWAILKKEKWW